MIRIIISFSIIICLNCYGEDFFVAKRVISLSPHLTELAYSAGMGQNLVGVSSYSDYPKQASLIPIVANYNGINVEKVLRLKPDLILAWSGGNSPKQIEQLKKFGIKILYSDPKSINDIIDTVKELSHYVKNKSVAYKNIESFQVKLQKIKNKYPNLHHFKYFYQMSLTNLMTSSGKSWPNAIFSFCGGTNVINEIKDSYPVVNKELVIQKKPNIIFSVQSKEDTLSYWNNWKDIPAIKNKNIIKVNSDILSRPTFRILTQIKYICKKAQESSLA